MLLRFLNTKMKFTSILLIIIVNVLRFTAQGPFAPAVDSVGTSAIHKDSSVFVGWASQCSVIRGYQDIALPSLGFVTAGLPENAVGPAGTNGVVSLGDGGSAIVTFSQPIINGDGWDFAVFENAFQNTFLELAFVEVSSDGVTYFRFPASSLTPFETQIGTFGEVDATLINNLAGKYRAQYGTPFDLEELEGTIGLDINSITHIRLIDVVGSINPLYASYDAQGNIVNEPYPTAFPQGGFDLDAVGVIHQQPLSVEEFEQRNFSVYPNPASNTIWIRNRENDRCLVQIHNQTGQLILEERSYISHPISVSNFSNGVYFVTITENQSKSIIKLIICH
jgi:hypothetical protein